jgi:hypothetical protein
MLPVIFCTANPTPSTYTTSEKPSPHTLQAISQLPLTPSRTAQDVKQRTQDYDLPMHFRRQMHSRHRLSVYRRLSSPGRRGPPSVSSICTGTLQERQFVSLSTSAAIQGEAHCECTTIGVVWYLNHWPHTDTHYLVSTG